MIATEPEFVEPNKLKCQRCGASYLALIQVVTANSDPGHPEHGDIRHKSWCLDCVLHWRHG